MSIETVRSLPKYKADQEAIERLRAIERSLCNRHPRVARKLDGAIEMIVRHLHFRLEGAQDAIDLQKRASSTKG